MEERENILSVETMREKRNISEVLYKKFTEANRHHNTHAFCFFEGEDGKYYDSRIAKYWGNNIIQYVAGNKKEVIKVMMKIHSDMLYCNVCTMFFVDRDYDESLEKSNEDLFETPCYSIENLYAQENVIERILQAEFGLNVDDEDFQKCLSDYKMRLSEFNNIIFKFNAVVKYQHKYAPNIKCTFSSEKTNRLAHITIEEVTKSCTHDEVIDKYIELLSPAETVLEELESELRAEEHPELILRGKNQLDFMVSMIKMWRELNNSGNYFSKKHLNVRINLSDNRLSELSQYAITPPELIDFLEKHTKTCVS